MQESPFSQMLRAKEYHERLHAGELKALRRLLRKYGERRFGPMRPADEAALDGITDPRQLERMLDRIVFPADWADLFNIA